MQIVKEKQSQHLKMSEDIWINPINHPVCQVKPLIEKYNNVTCLDSLSMVHQLSNNALENKQAQGRSLVVKAIPYYGDIVHRLERLTVNQRRVVRFHLSPQINCPIV